MVRSLFAGSISAAKTRSNGLRLARAVAVTVMSGADLSGPGRGAGSGQHFGDRGIDFVDRDRAHADIIGAGGLAMVVRRHAGRTGKPGIDRVRLAEGLIELRRLRTEQHDGR